MVLRSCGAWPCHALSVEVAPRGTTAACRSRPTDAVDPRGLRNIPQRPRTCPGRAGTDGTSPCVLVDGTANVPSVPGRAPRVASPRSPTLRPGATSVAGNHQPTESRLHKTLDTAGARSAMVVPTATGTSPCVLVDGTANVPSVPGRASHGLARREGSGRRGRGLHRIIRGREPEIRDFLR